MRYLQRYARSKPHTLSYYSSTRCRQHYRQPTLDRALHGVCGAVRCVVRRTELPLAIALPGQDVGDQLR